jgi:hypothetical protein
VVERAASCILCRARNEREHPTGVLGVRGCAAGCCSAGEIGARVYICEGHHGNVQPRRTRGLQISCSWRLVHLLEGERCSPWRANAPSRRQPENFPHACKVATCTHIRKCFLANGLKLFEVFTKNNAYRQMSLKPFCNTIRDY